MQKFCTLGCIAQCIAFLEPSHYRYPSSLDLFDEQLARAEQSMYRGPQFMTDATQEDRLGCRRTLQLCRLTNI
jgi:hypothetical protein